MADPFAAGLAVIQVTFGGPVTYTGAGLAGATIPAIRGLEPADILSGFSGKDQRISFEIDVADLPSRPKNNDTIVQGGTIWRVIDVNRRDDIGRYVLFVGAQ